VVGGFSYIIEREVKPLLKCQRKLTSEFETKDLDFMHYHLGQGKYTIEIL